MQLNQTLTKLKHIQSNECTQSHYKILNPRTHKRKLKDGKQTMILAATKQSL